ncbi:AraC family transcriptional regulator [Paenibacillus sp. 1001270B_150601_E10]|uniref:AraC family transcriptional regulator n=1 Tax=Paenibacillus sp. 1001270B_150601_E10 TaxID=2787079 RepID=UPI00189F089F|nr:AraC family transcriptional regulator [Paenibacillus sp. 1001270B_150601_E10]
MKLHIEYSHAIPLEAFQWTPSSMLEPFHTHQSLEIGVCLSGSGVFYFEQKRYPVSPGDVFLVNQTELHIAQADPDDPCSFIFVNFDPGILLVEDEKLLLPYSYQSDQFQNHIAADTELAKMILPRMKIMLEEMKTQEIGYLSRVRAVLIEIHVLFLRNYMNQISSDQWRRLNESYRELRIILHFIHEQYTSDIQLADAAKLVGWSSGRTSRFFRECMGQSLKDYIQALRIREVTKKLVSTYDPISELCFDCGFQSMASFYRAFQKVTGMSPKSYREKFGLGNVFENWEEDNEKRM